MLWLCSEAPSRHSGVCAEDGLREDTLCVCPVRSAELRKHAALARVRRT